MSKGAAPEGSGKKPDKKPMPRIPVRKPSPHSADPPEVQDKR